MNMLRLWLAILAAEQSVSGGLGLLGWVPSKVVGVVALVSSALQIGTVMYLTGANAGPPTPLQPAQVVVAPHVDAVPHETPTGP